MYRDVGQSEAEQPVHERISATWRAIDLKIVDIVVDTHTFQTRGRSYQTDAYIPNTASQKFKFMLFKLQNMSKNQKPGLV